MERLTFEGDFCDIAMCLETRGGSFCEEGACSQRRVWERLKNYEDLEEQGRLVVLPCKVGDTVWVINSLWVSEYTITSVYWDNVFFQFKSENETYSEDCRYFSFFDERIGKTVFLTREEAEAALKEEEDHAIT